MKAQLPRAFVGLVLILLTIDDPMVQGQVYLKADGTTSDTYQLINSVLGPRGASEVPDCKHNVRHIWQDHDPELNHAVFHFSAHVHEDDDRCVKFDRQRTEIRPDPGPLTASFGDTVSHSWDFRLDSNFQVSYMYTHLSQIKAVGGNDSMPIVTLQALKTENDDDLMMVIHMDGKALNSTTNSTILDSTSLEQFRGHWIHVQQEATYGWNGSYFLTATRIHDGQVLLRVVQPTIEMWRYDDGDDLVLHTRPKWGIYRSLNYLENLRDEVVKFDNFCIGKNGEYCP